MFKKATLSQKTLIVSGIIVLGAFIILGAELQNSFSPTIHRMKAIVDPLSACSPALTYSIGTIDQRFGLSDQQFIQSVDQGAGLWNAALGKEVLVKMPEGGIKVNLIYDYRQEATRELQKLGSQIKTDARTYDNLKAKYNALTKAYFAEKADYDSKLASYDSLKAEYDASMSYWDGQGGVPKTEYANLERQRQEINYIAADLNILNDKLKNEIGDINETAAILNRLSRDLNINTQKFNTVGSTTGSEFDEGEYVRNNSGQTVNIYQYENSAKLVRVIAHEFGHAIGLGHATDTESIMSEKNVSNTVALSTGDRAQLLKICGVAPNQ